ncbi:MAG: Uncharacterized DUF1579 protein, partial [uncultured Phycisphaerae bacterium]
DAATQTRIGTPLAAEARRRLDLRGRGARPAGRAVPRVHRDGARPAARRRLGRGRRALPGPRRDAGRHDDDARLQPPDEAVRRHLGRRDDDPPVGVRRVARRRPAGADARERRPELRRPGEIGPVPRRHHGRGGRPPGADRVRPRRRRPVDHVHDHALPAEGV